MPDEAHRAPDDPYKVLQVDPEADPDVIQAAYRRLAHKFHPDLAPGPEAGARMAAINRAWETLRDPERRAAHDRTRGRTSAGTGPSPGTSTGRASGDEPVGAGPPPGRPSGPVLGFGRYAGWSLGEIARRDVQYLEWLDRMPIGRPYREEIDRLLRSAGLRRSAEAEAADRHGLFRRR